MNIFDAIHNHQTIEKNEHFQNQYPKTLINSLYFKPDNKKKKKKSHE